MTTTPLSENLVSWCFHLWLWGKGFRGIFLKAPLQRDVLRSEATATRFICREPCAVFCPPGGTGRVGTESEDQARCTLSVVRRPNESLGAVSDRNERDR